MRTLQVQDCGMQDSLEVEHDHYRMQNSGEDGVGSDLRAYSKKLFEGENAVQFVWQDQQG